MISSTGKSDIKGSVLLESLLAVVILSIGLTFVIGSFLKTSAALTENLDYFDAVLLLEQKVNDIKMTLAEDLSGGVGGSEPSLREIVAEVSWTKSVNKRISAATYVFDRE